MKKKSLSVAIIALSLSLTGCISPSESQNAGVSPAYEQEVTDTTYSQPQDEDGVETSGKDYGVERVLPGSVEQVHYKDNIHSDHAYTATFKSYNIPENDNDLKLVDRASARDGSYVLYDSGTIEKTPSGKQAAEGEELIYIQSRTFLPDQIGPLPVEVLIDGQMIDKVELTREFKALIVSAPVGADVALRFTYADNPNVFQSIDVKTGERLSKGQAEAWYQMRFPYLDEQNHDRTDTQVFDDGSKAIFKVQGLEVRYTPFTSAKGWADDGKAAWLVISTGEPEFTYPGGSLYDVDCSITATDEVGKTYHTDDTYAPNHTNAGDFHFLVPVSSTMDYEIDFTCSSGNIEVSGEKFGKTKNLTETIAFRL